MTAGVVKAKREATGQVRNQKLSLKTIGGESMQVHDTILIVPRIGDKVQLHLVLQHRLADSQFRSDVLFLEFEVGILAGERH